jgi:choline dehydrogenase-like flavoprotein
VMDGARRALLSSAEIQFAAGARSVTPVHELARPYRSWSEARSAIEQLPMRPHMTRVVSAHVMGGCAMAGQPELGVVNPQGRHWLLQGLSVHDGSLFPTSLGVNPQLSIYGLVNMLASQLARDLGGGETRLD